jgi:chromodomain-helicase-DNA-binding protein 4
MSEDQEDLGPEMDQDEIESNAEDESLQEAPETSGGDKGTTVKKKKKGRKSKKNKGNKDGSVHPDTQSLEEICKALSITDIKINYTPEEFNEITNTKAFTSRFRVRFQDVNPNVNATKMQPYVVAKYREFQELSKAWRAKNSGSVSTKQVPIRDDREAKVPSLKIRISRRMKKRNQDDDEGGNSDHEFEQLLKAHERQQDEEEKAKEERRQSRRAAAAAKKKAKIDEVRFIPFYLFSFLSDRTSRLLRGLSSRRRNSSL